MHAEVATIVMVNLVRIVALICATTIIHAGFDKLYHWYVYDHRKVL